MKKSFFLLLILVGLVPMSSFAQMTLLRDNGTGMPITADPFLGVKGSPYFDEFKKGIIYLATGQKVEGLSIALNAYSNTLEYKLEGGLFAYTPEKVTGFSYLLEAGGSEYTSAYVVPTLKSKRFLKIVEKGTYTLLFHAYKTMTDDPSATYGAQASKVFQDQQEFFVVVNEKVMLMKNKEKDLQQIFGAEVAKATSYIKSERIDFKKSEDLQSLIRHMNQN
jgi:hypothetical protein